MSTEMTKVTVELEGHTYDLWKDQGDGIPRAKDLDAARWLGFGRERDFRKLIERHAENLGELRWDDKNTNDCEVRATVAQTYGRGGRPGKTYYLTREQVLYLAAKSETPRAVLVLKTMVAVFALALDGKLGNLQELNDLADRCQALEAQVRLLGQHQQPVIGQGLRKREEDQIRHAVGLPLDVPLRLLPMAGYARLEQELYRRDREARRDALAADRLRQRELRV